jgi:hypothetical protein
MTAFSRLSLVKKMRDEEKSKKVSAYVKALSNQQEQEEYKS